MIIRITINKIRNFLMELLKRMFPKGSCRRRLLLRARDKLEYFGHVEARSWRRLDSLLAEFNSYAKKRNKTVVTVISPVRLDKNEGQRVTNLTHEMIRKDIVVLFFYWRWENEKAAPFIEQRGILQIPMDMLLRKPAMFFRSFSGLRKFMLIEYPHPGMYGPMAIANAEGWISIYDVVDDWAAFHQVGQAHWYDPLFEEYLLEQADVLTAVHPYLIEMIEGKIQRSPVLVPNGLAPQVSDIDKYRRLEKGTITLGYFGYLSEAWFDWSMVLRIAEGNPSWLIYLVGYGFSSAYDQLPSNIVFLGKKPRHQLASYAQNWDVAIIPFKKEAVARGADPIKTYEYLAMGLPVVASGVEAPIGGEKFVRIASDTASFVDMVHQAVKEETVHERNRFARTCTWDRRLDTLFSASLDSNRVHCKKFLFGEAQ